MTKLKVLFIGPLPPPYSGPELSMKQFLDSKELNDTFNLLFLQTNFRKSNKNKGKFGIGMILNFFVFFFNLCSILVFKRPKLVYYPVTPTQFGWIGRDVWTILLCKLFQKKVIIHLRGSHFKLNFKTFKPWAQKLVAFSLKKVDLAIVQANYLNDQFEPFIPSDRVKTLYQSMDLEEYPFSSKEKRVKGKILVIGHLTKAKGYTDILKIIPDVAKQYPFVQFCFAGEMRKGERGVFFNQVTNEKIKYEDPFEEEKKILNSKYASNYQNLGLISGQEKLDHLQSAALFISASYSEGFSRALLESMSTGTPLIYTPVGAHREVLNDANGKSFNPGDIETLKKNVVEMLKLDFDEKTGKRNRSQVEQDFSIFRVCTDFKNILLDVIKK